MKIGDALVHAGVQIHNIYGGTEFGSTTTLLGDAEERKGRKPEDWSWMRFSKRVNVRWIPQSDGSFECQFLVSVLS